MAKQLSKRQAWLVIAEAYYTPRKQRRSSSSYYMSKERLALNGLCWAIETDLYEGRCAINERACERMCSVIERNLETNRAYFCKYSPTNDLLRADFCYMQAQMLTKITAKELKECL